MYTKHIFSEKCDITGHICKDLFAEQYIQEQFEVRKVIQISIDRSLKGDIANQNVPILDDLITF